MATFSSFVSHRTDPHLPLPPDDGLTLEGLTHALRHARSRDMQSTMPSRETTPAAPDFPTQRTRDSGDHAIHIEHSSLEIALPSGTIILRGAGGDYEPALLTGEVVLNLAESTNIKEITLDFSGKAKIAYNDTNHPSSRTYNDSVPLIDHHWSFLQGERRHMHTLKAGRHVFPFQLQLNGNLPATVRTMGGTATISYKLRANAVRSAFATNFQDVKMLSVVRAFTLDALEYTQTLELENTWPGKVMYSIMIPHKAHAAGTLIPVSVKFTPLAKGVRIENILTEVKEYTTLATKGGNFSTARTAATSKHVFDRQGRPHEDRPGRYAGINLHPSPQAAALRRQAQSTQSLTGLAIQAEADTNSSGHPSHASSLNTSPVRTPERTSRDGHVVDGEGEDNLELGQGDGEIEATFKVPLPVWTTPSHQLKPVQVSHKLKWCCMLTNLDGHTSELRCALPIHVLAPSLADEARTATSGSHSLLFGAAEAAEEPLVELPSYPEHVRDRVANAFSDATAVVSATASAYPSPGASPRMGGMSALWDAGSMSVPADLTATVRFAEPESLSRESTRLDLESYFPRTSSFVDSELLASIGHAFGSTASSSSHPNSHAVTPSDSRASSRPNSRPASRHGSRAPSPEPRMSSLDDDITPSPVSDSTSRGASLFHLPMSIKPLTTFSGKGKGKATTPPDGLPPNHSSSSSSLAATFANARRRASRGTVSRPSSPPHHNSTLPPPVPQNPLSQVPNYDIASRGFLGGGVVPLTASQGLPSYDEAERLLRNRSRSETSLTDLQRAVEEASLTDHDPGAGPSRHVHMPHGLAMTTLRRT